MVIACSYLFRSLGSSIGIATSSAVLQQVLRTQLMTQLKGYSGGDNDAEDIIDRVRRSLDTIKDLDPDLQAIVRRCYQLATMGSLVPVTVFLSLSFVAAVMIREKRLG